ncbi:MAG: hypothetical protein ACRC67_03895 [Inquilinus sp.]|uniref:hypothetical protein n=1 Tax=Inquilinus sp. TaxID=1932117 RepID=UPI003F2F0EF9
MRIIALAAALAICGCAYKMQNQFNAAEYTAYQGAGTGKIVGQAFLRQQGGGVVTCAGSPAFAVPATAYTREIATAAVSGRAAFGIQGQAPIGSLGSAKKDSQCDAEGNFEITGLKAGNWIVMSQVSWTVGYYSQGGVVYKEVYVSDGQAQKVLLTY